ncbi:MAG: hypothetical protein MUF34_03525 [Polyangiaceae bacterium]|jgi:hypothetical protein|nr:hypothetical protein [Polyangiaceae bacterium]
MAVDVRQSPINTSLHRPFSSGARHLRQFLDVVDEVYRGDPNFVRPLDFDLGGRLSPKNPFFQHAEGILLTARRGGRVLGRATAQVDREHLARYRDDVGFFGFFDTVDDQEVASALLEHAGRWLRDKGMRTMRGPLSLSINEELGCLVEGFDTPPMLLMPHHRAYQGGLIEGAGLAKVKDVYAWRYGVGEVPTRARRAADEIAALPEVSSRQLEPKHLDRDVRLVMDIFNDAWFDNWGSVPLTEAELKKMAEDFRLLLVPELTLLVSVDGEPVAFAVALPNLNAMIRDLHGKLLPTGLAKLLWRLKVSGPDQARLALLGVRRKLRHVRKYAGLSTYMYVKMNEAGQRLGIRQGELSWTLEDNGPVNAAIRFMGGRVYKRYRVYEQAL